MVGFALSSFFVLFGLLLGLLAIATFRRLDRIRDNKAHLEDKAEVSSKLSFDPSS
jgi:hypothetical protein